MPSNREQAADDVAAASAAYLWNVLPSIAELPDTDGFARLKMHFLTAIQVYQGEVDGETPASAEPSPN